jgi:hypothetical protein
VCQNSSSESLHTKKKLTIYQHVCPPLASIIVCNLVGMEWHSRRSFWPLIIFHSLAITTLKSLVFLGHIEPCWIASFKIFQRFSIGLRLGEFDRFWITFYRWIIWFWILIGILTTSFQVHGKNFKVKYQVLISLEAFKVDKLDFFPLGNQKRHSALDPIVHTFAHKNHVFEVVGVHWTTMTWGRWVLIGCFLWPTPFS